MSSPAIRFAGFTDDWEESKLGEISDIRTGPFGSTLHAEDYVEDGTPIITTEHFKSGNLPEQKNGIPQVSDDDLRRLQNYALKTHDIVFSRVGSVDINARITPVQNGWLFSGRVLRVRTDKHIDSQYLHYELSTNRAKTDVINRAVGQTMPSINTEILKMTDVYIPSEIKEQQGIGVFMSAFDRLITLHQREHDKTVNIKKALLEKMFPKDGEDKPEIRFAGFTASWERRDIGACFSERNERSGTGDLISVTMNSGVMRAEDLGRHDTSSNDKSNYKKVEVGDIAYNSMRMWQGASGYSPYSGILSPAYTVIIPQEGMHSPFFAYLFKRSNMIHQFQMNSQGLTSDTWNLKWPSLRTICVIIPEFEEQRRISELFAGIDRLITIHQCELTKLQNIKKALLEKMFV